MEGDRQGVWLWCLIWFGLTLGFLTVITAQGGTPADLVVLLSVVSIGLLGWGLKQMISLRPGRDARNQ